MKNNQKGFVGILVTIIIALVAVGSGAYVYTQNKGDVEIDEKEAVPQKIDEQQNSISKTYQNKKYGFEFSYPPEFLISSEGETVIGVVPHQAFLNLKMKDGPDNIEILITENLSVELNKNIITVGGKEAIGYKSGTEYIESYIVDLPLNNNKLEIIFSSIKNEYWKNKVSKFLSDDKELINKILSTFKFATMIPDASTKKQDKKIIQSNNNPPSLDNSIKSISSSTKILSVAEFNQNTTKNVFQTFGDVLYNNGEYLITEKANAGIFATVDVPEYSLLTFKFKFINAGDGDFLSIYTNQDINGKPIQQEIYRGLNLEISRDGYTEQEVDMLLQGKTQIVFNQISRGNSNSVLAIKDIKIKSYSDEVNIKTPVNPSLQQTKQSNYDIEAQTAAAVIQLDLIPQSDIYYNTRGSYAGFCASTEYKSKISGFPSSVSLKCLDGEGNFAVEFSYKNDSFNFCIDSISGEMQENKKIMSVSNGYVCSLK